MSVSPIQPRAEAADVEPEEIARNSKLTEDQKIGEVTRQFEAILLRQILQSTQKNVIPSKYADNSTAAGIYHDMVTHQLADSISKSGTLGLAKMLQHQLTRQLQPASMAGHERDPEAQPTALAGTSVARPSSRPSGQKLNPLNSGHPLHPLHASHPLHPLNTGHKLHPLTSTKLHPLKLAPPSKGTSAS
jgi:Rod binding domain-containing protein